MSKQLLVCIVIASSVLAASCAKSHGGGPSPKADGTMKLEMQGNKCVIKTKDPESTPQNPQKFQAGSTFTWDVTNNCSVDATMGMADKDKLNGNNLTVRDPFKGLTQSPVPFPANSTGTVSVTVKTKQELNPTSIDPGNRKWKFNWTVNCDKQNDPEIEIEGI